MDIRRISELPLYHKRTFIALLFLLVILLVGLDFVFFQQGATPSPLLTSISGYTQSIVAAIVVALFTFILVSVFLPNDNVEAGLGQLQPGKITTAFEQQLKEAQSWQYRGNFGRYLRGKVLPTLSLKTGANVTACIIDPNDTKLCDSHVRYRSQIQGIDKGRQYTKDIVALEIIVTIVHCAWYLTAKGLSVDLFLSSVFDPVRADASNQSMIVTVEDRRRPALLLQKSHFMYEHFNLQMAYARQQGKKLALDSLVYRKKMSELTDEDIQQFLEKIEMGKLCAEIGAATIREACNNIENPYET